MSESTGVQPAPQPEAAGLADRQSSDQRVLSIERQLALVDRVIGLEAEIAEATIRYQMVQGTAEIARLTAENAAIQHRLNEILASRTWRLGIKAGRMLAPVRKASGALRGRGARG